MRTVKMITPCVTSVAHELTLRIAPTIDCAPPTAVTEACRISDMCVNKLLLVECNGTWHINVTQ